MAKKKPVYDLIEELPLLEFLTALEQRTVLFHELCNR